MNKIAISLAAALISPIAFASDLNVSIKSGGQSTITVVPGATVNYTVTGELSDAVNEGLAYYVFDLEFEGGALTPAATPNTSPMNNFASPLGLNNPSGFGGTVSGGKLVQVGGSQNTWNNSFAAQPLGSVITDVGQPGQPATLATGTLTAPLKVGSFRLKVKNLDANVIKLNETGLPFWAVAQAGDGTVTDLIVKVSALSTTTSSLSFSAGGALATLSLDAGPAFANRTYLMLGSFSGTSPGVYVNAGVKLPLNFDSYFNHLLLSPNPPVLQNSIGVLNAQGKATATYVNPTDLRPTLIGLQISHAYLLTPTNDFASDAVTFTLTP